jgi:hypothetical protein
MRAAGLALGAWACRWTGKRFVRSWMPSDALSHEVHRMTLPDDSKPDAERPAVSPGPLPARPAPARLATRRWDGWRTIVTLAALAAMALAAGCGRGRQAARVAPARSGTAAAAGAKAVEIQEDPMKTGIESADASLAGKVRAGLAADPRLRPLPIEIDAEAGRVTLWGHVDRPEQREAAERLARRTPGVTSIVNHIKIGG